LRLWKVRNNRLAVDANGAPIIAGAGCSVASGVAQCGGKSFAVAAGAGTDRITVSGAVHSTQDGGDGNDWMIGGTSSDVFTGGAGFDVVDYSTRTGTITGTPGTGADDGTRREGDNIMGDVEQVILPAAKAH
jgi:Ca2+-binding RTX toxin-like protein